MPESLIAQCETLERLRGQFAAVIVGQQKLINRLLLALLASGHALIESVPGLGKTLAVTTLARAVNLSFRRIQFTPDLLPADLLGTLVYNPKTAEFEPRLGPIFANIILADEINRAPAKVQSALLEAMQERQVTIGGRSFALEEPFLVLATQNPIEQEGTYPLPEAQVDRFMLKLTLPYPGKEEELEILRRMAGAEAAPAVEPVVSGTEILHLRRTAAGVYMDRKVEEYIVALVDATRHPEAYRLDIGELIRYGASPRATIFLARAAKVQALLEGRAYAAPQDVKEVAMDVLRHRLIVSYEAEARGETAESLLGRIFDAVPVP